MFFSLFLFFIRYDRNFILICNFFAKLQTFKLKKKDLFSKIEFIFNIIKLRKKYQVHFQGRKSSLFWFPEGKIGIGTYGVGVGFLGDIYFWHEKYKYRTKRLPSKLNLFFKINMYPNFFITEFKYCVKNFWDSQKGYSQFPQPCCCSYE